MSAGVGGRRTNLLKLSDEIGHQGVAERKRPRRSWERWSRTLPFLSQLCRKRARLAFYSFPPWATAASPWIITGATVLVLLSSFFGGDSVALACQVCSGFLCEEGGKLIEKGASQRIQKAPPPQTVLTGGLLILLFFLRLFPLPLSLSAFLPDPNLLPSPFGASTW